MNTAESTYQLQKDRDFAWSRAAGAGDPSVMTAAERAYAQTVYAEYEAADEAMREAQAEIGGIVFRIPEQNIAMLEERIDKLNKRADKLGVEPVTLTGHEDTEIRTRIDGVEKITVYRFVVITGQSPRLAGWRFVATLEHDDEQNAIIRRLPTFDGEADLTAYRKATPDNCDHCGFRRRRKDTYIVQHEDGTLKQVGSNCLVDFLGGASPASIARWMEYVADLMDALEDDESEFYGGSAPQRIPTDHYLTHVACMIRESGWQSRSSAYDFGGYPTADAAISNMENMVKKARDRQGSPLWTDTTDEDAAKADAAIEWVRGFADTDDEVAALSEFEYNMFTILKADSITHRQLGIAAYAVEGYRRNVEKIAREQARAKTVEQSDYIGTVGDKVELTVTLVSEFRIEDRYSYNGGTKPLYTFVDDDGNQIKWFSSRDIAELAETGVKVTLKGTIKSHDDGTGRYGDKNYGKSTVLTRCKVVG